MRVFLIFSLIFLISCNSNLTQTNELTSKAPEKKYPDIVFYEGGDLSVFRDFALDHLVERITAESFNLIKYEKFYAFSFKRPRNFMESFWITFQKDNVDRSWVTLQFENETSKTTCGLYIRELSEDKRIFINLLECEGPKSEELSNLMPAMRIDVEDYYSEDDRNKVDNNPQKTDYPNQFSYY